MLRLLVLAALVVAAMPALAVDVDPSKPGRLPPEFANPNRGRLDPWIDPEKINRVNTIARKEYDVELLTTREGGARAGLRVSSRSKRPTTFFFDDARRIDVIVRDGERVSYRWSSNKKFVKSAGTAMLMPGESMEFLVDVPAWVLDRAGSGLEAGLAGYPEFVARRGR
jgi:hypothetical protein